MGSFRLAARRRYLHRHFNFTESAVETEPKSLRRSCASELTRQGTSLTDSRPISRRGGLYLAANRRSSLNAHSIPGFAANLPLSDARLPTSVGRRHETPESLAASAF